MRASSCNPLKVRARRFAWSSPATTLILRSSRKRYSAPGPGRTHMSADLLTRRTALFGAAALLAPLPNILIAAPNPSPSKTSLIKLDGNENPYGPSPAARQAILASVGEAPRYADEAITTLTNQ